MSPAETQPPIETATPDTESSATPDAESSAAPTTDETPLEIGSESSEFASLEFTQIESGDAEVALFEVDLEADMFYVVSVRTLDGDLDPTVSVTDASGAPLGDNDDGPGTGLDSELLFLAETTGPGIVEVGTYSGTGQFDLTISEALFTGGQVRSSSGEKLSVVLPEGVSFSSVVSGLDTFDPQVTVTDPSGNVIASDDDSAGTFDARVQFETTEQGEYTMTVEGFGDSTGEFIIYLFETP